MLVITLTDCMPSLRGDLSKWLQEINTGVFVGQVSTRVREELWARVKDNAKKGRATMVYSAGNEQRMDFRVHNNSWEPIDFDGLKLMLRPSAARLSARYQARVGYSKAANFHRAKTAVSYRAVAQAKPMADFVVVDVETTGLSAQKDEIIELSAVKAADSESVTEYTTLIRPSAAIPPSISKLTGITDRQLSSEGRALAQVLPEFLSFIGSLPVVSHNARFDMAFLRAACERCELPLLANRFIDTLALARKWIKDAEDYRLTTLANHLNIPCDNAHRSRNDCLITLQLYRKLMEICDTKK